MRAVDFLPPARIFFSEVDRQEISRRIETILSSGHLTLGPFGEEFESRFAEYVGRKYAVAVSSGTSALEIVLRAWNINSASVLVPTNTFFATPAAVLHAGGEVVLVDQTHHSTAPSLSQLKAARKKNTKAVVLVHIGGVVSPEVSEIKDWCRREGIKLLEDAAHAHGSVLNGRQAGSFGDAACFSFYPTKVMTSGEGGMIVTDDESLAVEARRYRDQGKESFTVNKHVRLGNNWRMSEIHAAIGLQQLKKLPDFLSARRSAAHKIYERLKEVRGIQFLDEQKLMHANYYKLIALLEPSVLRQEFKKKLKEKKRISLAGEVYEIPCHKQPIFENMQQLGINGFENAEKFCDRHICLPIYNDMSEHEVDYLCDGIKEVLHD